MKNTGIQKYSLMKNTLEPRSYTLFLLREGLRRSILDQKAVDEFQEQLMPLLAELILKYTRGESSSVTVETAQRLLGSLLYSTDAYLKSFRHKEAAINCLTSSCPAEIYGKGQALISTCLEQTRILYQEVKERKMNIPIKGYNYSIDEDLPDFLNQYDPLFNAQDTMAGIDYPLFSDNMRLQGIFYIEQYLKKLSMETDFCHLFSPADINQLLRDYGRVYRIDIAEALINVFEIIFINSVFSFLACSPPGDLSISNSQINMLQHHFDAMNPAQYPMVISQTIDKLLKLLGVTDPDFINYIEVFVPLFMPRFVNALENKSLANVIIAAQPYQEAVRVALDHGERLSDEAFRKLAEQIRETVEPASKVNFITSNINSLADFLDVLEADCLFGQDYVFLFNILGDIELSILAKIAFAEQLRGRVLKLQNLIVADLTIIWQIELAYYFHGLSAKRLDGIEQRLKDILYTP
ncbi:MAG: DUF6179 domain-containing protein [Syntrophomonas sp.]